MRRRFHEFRMFFTLPTWARLVFTLAALRRKRVYGPRTTTPRDVIENAVVRECDRLENEHNNGRPFPRARVHLRGRPGRIR